MLPPCDGIVITTLQQASLHNHKWKCRCSCMLCVLRCRSHARRPFIGVASAVQHQASQQRKATSSHDSAEPTFSSSRECLYKLSSLPESSQQQLHIDESAGSIAASVVIVVQKNICQLVVGRGVVLEV